MARKLLVSLIFSLICLGSLAQTEIKVRQRKPIEPYHNFTFGVGFFPMMGGVNSRILDLDRYNTYSFYSYDHHRMYQSNVVNIPSFNLGYYYDVLRWLSVGGVVSYSYTGATYYDGLSDSKVGSFGISNLSLTAMVRFTWLRRPMVRLYSQLGLGMGLYVHSNKLFGNRKTDAWEGIFAGQINYLGVQVGRKVYGYAELLGLGSHGALVLGVGYRFMDKKR